MNRLFLVSAIGALLFFCEFFTLSAIGGIEADLPNPLSWALIVFTGYSCLSWMAIYFGMIYYWLIHDRRRNWWAVGVATFGLFSVFYYFFVYRRDMNPRGAAASAS